MEHTENASETKRWRYTIFYLLDDLPEGATFKPSALHINILPWFALETAEKPFVDWFYRHFDAVEAFDATVSEPRMFGPQRDVPVNLVEPHDKFLELHKLALSWFGVLGARWAERDPYVGDDYKPHIAQRHGISVEEGQKLSINYITLVKGLRHDDQVRHVAAHAHLHG